MSRSGYIDDYDDVDYPAALWRGAVASSIRGKRGQEALKEMLAALDAMPVKRLVAKELEIDTGMPFHRGDVCALGALGKARGMDLSKYDPDDTETVAGAFNVAEPLAREILWVNDEAGPPHETPEQRWARVRAWVASRIQDAATQTKGCISG